MEFYAEPIPGPTTEQMAHFAREWRAGICFGLVERASDGIFNSVVLISREGKIQVVQRKISEKPPYAAGQQVRAVQTEFGKVAILICGDLFDNEAIQQVPSDTQLVIVPMARGFDKQSPDRKRWEDEERQVYQKAVTSRRSYCYSQCVGRRDRRREFWRWDGIGWQRQSAGRITAWHG